MSDNTNQLAALGQQVIDAIISTYVPDRDSGLALSLHPGQPLADALVQDGATNPLRLSEWLADQYDYPMWLERATSRATSSSLVGGITAKGAYTHMIPWAAPAVDADAPAFPRIAALIAQARQSLGENPEALPFGCEPTDFATTTSSGWHVFDTTISSSTTTVVEGAPSTALGIGIDPELWKLRAVDEAVLTAVAEAQDAQVDDQRRLIEELSELPRHEVIERLRGIPCPEDYDQDASNAWLDLTGVAVNDQLITNAVANATIDGTEAFVLDTSVAEAAVADVAVADVVEAVTFDVALETTVFASGFASHLVGQFDAAQAERLTSAPDPSIRVVDRLGDDAYLYTGIATPLPDANPPADSSTTTTKNELHVHFEYCLLTITRRGAAGRWWLPEMVSEKQWYVPGMSRGDMIRDTTKDGWGHYLPHALLVVRSVSLTGSWSAAALDTVGAGYSYVGPFLINRTSAASSETSVETISVLGTGHQIIGELCAPLPPLPPRSDPTLET